MDLKKLVRDLKGFEGVTRKSDIGSVLNSLGINETRSGILIGDDAAVLSFDNKTLLFAADSINEKLLNQDPYFAGYSAILVNVNDIAAMGGTPKAVVNVISAKDKSTALDMARGLRDGSEKCGVPVVGGHLNPNSTYNGVEVSIIGEIKKRNLMMGSSARSGDIIIAAIDLDGKASEKYPLAWDSTSQKNADEVQRNLKILSTLAKKKIVTSCRDISNPGIIGTIGMILEQSKVGGVLDVEKISPPNKVPVELWLKMYPGYGFVFTTNGSNVEKIISLFKNKGVWADSIGVVLETPKLLLHWKEDEEELFNFEKERITGV